ncbi:hypothetical protein ACTZGI_04915 [Rahnella aceris]|uniref:hypothetical protein n=1 Tax=Rahnella sp. (strain Y9602) TaxID=2703885 RepID=UPI003FD642D6
MKTIFESLVDGNAKERLAIIADITSIAGVSLGTVTGGLLALTALTDKLDVGNLVGVTIISLIGLALFCFFIAGFIWILTKLFSKIWRTPPGVQLLVKCAVWLIFICFLLLAGTTFYGFISGFRILI